MIALKQKQRCLIVTLKRGNRLRKIVIIGANEFQNPLIIKAKELGFETHVFAWKEGAVGEKNADYFYPISIVEKDDILKKCQKINPDAVITIGSDLAMITVQYVASRLNLPCNSDRSIEISTNKYCMRSAFEEAGISVPKYVLVDENTDVRKKIDFSFPVIVKPTDRSGSRGITKLYDFEGIEEAVKIAVENSFEKKAIIEEYMEGEEYSFESISFAGEHVNLAITKKYTTGSPNYIEIGHIEPSGLEESICKKAKEEIFKALDALEIKYGASHVEFKVDVDGNIRIIEIGARMGGDCIGSDLVYLSTGYDFIKMVIQVALGEKPAILQEGECGVSVVRFIMNQKDLQQLRDIKKENADKIKFVSDIQVESDRKIVDSGSRYGYYILRCDSIEEAKRLTKL